MGSDDEMDLMAIRAKNMAELNNMFGDVFSEAQKIVNEVNNDLGDFLAAPKVVYRQKRKRDDETYQFNGIIPSERRKSARLMNVTPRYSYDDLEKIEGLEDQNNDKDPDFYINLEEIIRAPSTKRRIISHRASVTVRIRMPEEITESELNKIAKKGGNKTYSQYGTSCHQCRQKTLDTKTVCRSRRCIGVRGQFCGPCLRNRYGEDAREALLDPTWVCPTCRGLCNCSVCRTRDGKRPTGILAPMVQQEGYTSVKDFLLNLAEKGILSKDNNKMKKSPEKRRFDDVISTEETEGVINALINSYVTKMIDKQLKYETAENNDLPSLYGFVLGQPVHPATEDDLNGDVIGFTEKHCCFSCDNIVYMCPLL